MLPSPNVIETISAYLGNLMLSKITRGPLTPVTVLYSFYINTNKITQPGDYLVPRNKLWWLFNFAHNEELILIDFNKLSIWMICLSQPERYLWPPNPYVNGSVKSNLMKRAKHYRWFRGLISKRNIVSLQLLLFFQTSLREFQKNPHPKYLLIQVQFIPK